MGALDRHIRRRAERAAQAAADAASQRVRAAQQLLADAREGVDPNAAAGLSASAGVRQAATGQLPGDGDPSRSVDAPAAWDRAARSGDVAPVLRARSAPVAELVADDLEQTLLEAMDIRTDSDGVLGVNEKVFADLERRIQLIGTGGDIERAAVQILARRYGVPDGASLKEAATTISEGLAGQRLAFGPAVPLRDDPRIIDSRLQRIASDPFPERPTSLEGFPEADETFDPVEIPDTQRIPRFEYDRLGRVKLDADGNPVPRLDPEGRPTFEIVTRRRIVPQRTVSGSSEVIPVGEFTTIGARRTGSDGNRSAEQREFVLNRGDGTYQLSTITEDGRYRNEILSEAELGRRMIDSGYERLAGPELGFTVKAPTEGEAESLGRMLAESVRPGAATREQLAEVVRRIDEIGGVFDGALADRALQAAGFRQPGDELSAGRQILELAREQIAAEPPSAPVAAASQAQTQPRIPATIEVRPPAAFASRGSGVTDAAGNSVRQARNMSSVASGPQATAVDVVAAPADASVFFGPDGQPITAMANPAAAIQDAAPPLPPPPGRFRPGILSGISEVTSGAGPGQSSISMGMGAGDGSVIDTGTLPASVPVTTSSSVSLPERLDLYQLSDVATPATPLLNFEATPGSWADQASRGAIDVGGVDTVRQIDPSDMQRASQQYRELGARQASVQAAIRTFADEPTGDLADIFQRMEELQEAEPAFRELDVTEQFEIASSGSDELLALSEDLDAAAADAFNPNTFTQSQSVSSPDGGSVFSTAQDLPPIQVALDRAGRVRQARDPSAPAAQPAADPSEVAFGIDASAEPARQSRARQQQLAVLRARSDANRRVESLLSKVENMYNPSPARAGEAGPLPSTPEQVFAYVRGSEEFFRLPDAEKRAVLSAIESPASVGELLNVTISQQKSLRQQLAGSAPAGARRGEPDAIAPEASDVPDNVTDIPEQRAEAEGELAESAANAEFYNAQRNNAGAGRPLSLRRIQDIVRRAIGVRQGDRLPLAFRDYDSRFGRRISRSDIERLNAVRGYINKYDSMSDAEYAALRERNTDLPPTRQENVDRLGAEFKQLARQVARETVQDADSSGANQARLVQNLLSDNPQTRLQAVRELFAVPGLRNAAGQRIGEDGLQVLELLARDPAFGSAENVLYDVLSRDQSIRNPELSRAPVVDESGAVLADRQRDLPSDGSVPKRGWAGVTDEDSVRSRNTSTGVPAAAGLGPESMREVAKRIAKDIGPAEGRLLTLSGLQQAGLEPTFLPDDSPAIRPTFIDRLKGYLPFLRRQAEDAPAGPQAVRRQGLDTAEQEIAAAKTPEEMNAVLARINRVREQSLAKLDDANDPPTVDGSGVERSARKQIAERADALIESWRRRMAQMQAASGTQPVGSDGIDIGLKIEADNAYAEAFNAARQAVGDVREAMLAGQRARQAVLSSGGRELSSEEVDSLAVPGGESDAPAIVANPRSDASSNRRRAASSPRNELDDAPRFNPAGYTVVFRDPDALANLGVSTRNKLLAEIDSRINKAKADIAAGRKLSTGSEIVPADTLASLQKERDRIATPTIKMLEDGRVSVQFAPGLDPLVGDLLRPVETDFGPVPPTFSGQEAVGVDFGPDGTPTIRKKGNVIDRRGQDVEFDPVPDVPRTAAAVVAAPRIELPPGYRWSEEGVAAPAAAAAPPAAAAARADREILEEFARPVREDDGPLEETIAYDDDALEVSADEALRDADIESSLSEPVPGPGRRRATEEYEAEQARKSQKGQQDALPRKAGVTARRVAAGAGLAGLVGVGGGTAVNTGLNTLVGSGVVGGLGFAPMASAYGESAPAGTEGDINTSAEPTGAQVRQARRRLSYLTSQNPLPY